MTDVSSPETLVLRHMADVGWLSVSGELFGLQALQVFPHWEGESKQPFPSTRAPPKEVWHQSLLPFLGKCCSLLHDFPGSACAATSPSSQITVISSHPGTPVIHQRCYQCSQIQCRTPALLQALWSFKALLLK